MSLGRREKRSLASTLVGHGVVLMAVFLSSAFVHRPKLQYMEIDLSPGGSTAAPAPQAAPPRAADPPAAPSRVEPEPPPPAPKPREFPTKKKPVKKEVVKKAEPKKKTQPKPAKRKPKVEVSRKLVSRDNPQPPSRAESQDDIRRRLADRLDRNNPSEGGSANRFAAYLEALRDELYVAWDQPASAEGGLKAVVKFVIQKDGRLTAARIVQASGIGQMDQSVLLAVKTLGSYDPWPEGFTASDAEIEVEFVCKPN